MKDNALLLKNIIWYDIDKNGYINKCFKNEGAIYIYKRNLSLYDKTRYYVGSSVRLANRINTHRWCIINYNKCIERGSGSPIFYRSILKHSWYNFKFGVLEYIDLSKIMNTKQKRKTLLDKEQYYLNSINPSLNVCKIADSPLGIKRNTIFSVNLSKSRRGKSIRSAVRICTTPKVVTNETRLKISSRCQGVNVKVFDKSNNFIKEFPTITSAALYFGVNTKTISMIFKTGKSYDDYIYKFEVKYNRIWVYDIKYKLIKVLDSIKKTSIWLNIPESTISDYIKSNKLYKNKYYFKNIETTNI